MRQKNQFSSDFNVKVEPKDDVIFLGIKSGNKDGKYKDTIVKYSVDFEKTSQWKNRNQKDDTYEREHNERSIERNYDRYQHSNRYQDRQDRYQERHVERDYQRSFQREREIPYERYQERPPYDRPSYESQPYDRPQQFERQQNFYPQPPIQNYMPPPQYQNNYQQPPFNPNQINQNSQDMQFMNNMFVQFFQKMMSGANFDMNQQNNSNNNQTNESKQDNKRDKKDDTPEPAKIDMKEIFNIEHRIEVVPKTCKLNRFKFLVYRAPYQSKILVYVDGKKTMDFLEQRLGGKIDGYVFVNINDYKPDPDIGQLIMLTDEDAEMASKMKEISICFNISEPKDFDLYCQRCAVFSGTGKKYSVQYITEREERFAQKIKDMLTKVNVTTFPQSLDQLLDQNYSEKSESEKKEIFDKSFEDIKNERYSFKLPRGQKKSKPENNQDQSGGFGEGQNQKSAWGKNQDSGWGGNNNQTQPSQNAWGGKTQNADSAWGSGNKNADSGWGGGKTQNTESAWGNGNQNADSGWGGAKTQNTESGWGNGNQNTDNGWGSGNQSQPTQDAWGGAQKQAEPVADGWGGGNQNQNVQDGGWGTTDQTQQPQDTWGDNNQTQTVQFQLNYKSQQDQNQWNQDASQKDQVDQQENNSFNQWNQEQNQTDKIDDIDEMMKPTKKVHFEQD